jgi:hypothetical protein
MGVAIVLVAVGVAVAVAAGSRGGDKARKPSLAPASQRFGDDADLMRRLERPKLVRHSR